VAWIVRLVQIGADGNEPFADVMTINRPDDLDDIANLGLTVADGKRVLAGLQQEIVAAPEPVLLAGDSDGDLIKMPFIRPYVAAATSEILYRK
jgi:hypothetical protein